MRRPAAFRDPTDLLDTVRRVVASRGPLNEPPERTDASIDRFLVSMRTLGEGLVDLTALAVASSRRWVMIASEWRGEAPQSNRYWQLLAFEDRTAIVEVVSNSYLAPACRHTATAEQRLREIGWRAPHRGVSPNWWAAATEPLASTDRIAREASLAMRDVLGFAETTKLLVTLFEFSYRAPTAARREWPDQPW
jgi:hypothetical protein